VLHSAHCKSVCNITNFFSRILEVAPPSCTSYTTTQALVIHTHFLNVGTCSVISVGNV
jgi:hypothetical protein